MDLFRQRLVEQIRHKEGTPLSEIRWKVHELAKLLASHPQQGSSHMYCSVGELNIGKENIKNIKLPLLSFVLLDPGRSRI
jgi:hypothetical protein